MSEPQRPTITCSLTAVGPGVRQHVSFTFPADSDTGASVHMVATAVARAVRSIGFSESLVAALIIQDMEDEDFSGKRASAAMNKLATAADEYTQVVFGHAT